MSVFFLTVLLKRLGNRLGPSMKTVDWFIFQYPMIWTIPQLSRVQKCAVILSSVVIYWRPLLYCALSSHFFTCMCAHHYFTHKGRNWSQRMLGMYTRLENMPGCWESLALFSKPAPLSMPFAQHASGRTIITFNALLVSDFWLFTILIENPLFALILGKLNNTLR